MLAAALLTMAPIRAGAADATVILAVDRTGASVVITSSAPVLEGGLAVAPSGLNAVKIGAGILMLVLAVSSWLVLRRRRRTRRPERQ